MSSQKAWDEPLVEVQFNSLKKKLETLEKDLARLMRVSKKESGQWLHALPSTTFGNRLSNVHLSCTVALRLGAPCIQTHECICGDIADKFGHHSLHCQKSAGRNTRHRALNETVKRALTSAGFPSTLEPVGLFREDGKRVDGMTLIPWNQGRHMVWDCTVVDSMCDSYRAGSIRDSSYATSKAEARKCRLYESISSLYNFIPIAFDCLGGFGPSAKAVIAKISQKIREESGDNRSHQFLMQRLSIEIQRGNSISILGSLPLSDSLENFQ